MEKTEPKILTVIKIKMDTEGLKGSFKGSCWVLTGAAEY